ncbi:unnamed protein product [Paramecium pentaurelia]|uniref:Transmembrane protein n=1 Tax=Paramecium pentaurelia TaxID=43138 RepID=A0A8S1XR51_9CILI|nr:unnamed protein product [Paramecium pentaurelia]
MTTSLLLFLLITIDILYSIGGMSKKCNVIEIEPQEKLISQNLGKLLIESDTEELEEQNYTNFNIINESIRISSFENEHIISTLIIDYFGFRYIEDQLFCKFIKNEIYYISCIKVNNYYENDRLNYLNEQIIISIELNDLNNSQCQEFFINQKSEFIIFCFENFHMKIYCIDLDNKIRLLQQYKINQNQYEICKRKYFKFDDNYYFISFYNCKYWSVYTYWQQEIKEILNEQLVNFKQVSYLENIQLCQNSIILILETGYLYFYINNLKQALYQVYFEIPSYLKYVLFTQSCSQLCYAQYNQSSNITTIVFHDNYEVLYSFEGTYFLIESIGKILFIQTQNQLQVIYNLQYQQTIKLNTQYMVFNKDHNLIYWLDEIRKEIIFYKLSYPRNLIEPTKKYIFYIESFSYYQKEMRLCYEIKQNMYGKYKLTQTLDFIYQCQNKSSLFYNKLGLQVPYQYDIKLDQNLEFGMNILDQHSFQQLCPKLQNLNQQDTILIYYETKTPKSFSVIQTKNYIYFQNCHDVNRFGIHIKDFQVFSFQSQILIYNQNKQELKLIRFIDQQITEFKIDSKIIRILQSQQFVLVFTSDNKDPMVIDLLNNYIIQYHQQMYQMLNKLNQIYLQDKQNFQNQISQHFYYSQLSPKYIYYNKYLMIHHKIDVKLFRLENIQIILIKEILSQQQYILGVHIIDNQIIQYYFDQEQISKISSLNLDEYQFIRPLKYQINTQYFAIACRNQTKTFVLIFEITITKSPKLIKVIEISRIYFFFKEYQLFYYNSEDEIKIFNMLNFEIQLENYIPNKNEIVEKTKVTFQIISANKSDPRINLGFILKSYNQCYQLFQKSNNFSININQQNIITSNYFYGPIESLKIEYNDKVHINGPLLLQQWIYQNNQIRIKNIIIAPLLMINQVEQNIIVFQDEFGQTIILNSEEIEFTKIIPINEQLILILYPTNSLLQLRGVIYLIDEDNSQLKQDPFLEMNFNLKIPHSEYHIQKFGDLIIFKSQSHLEFFQIINDIIQYIENDFNIIEISKIKGNNQLYITLSEQNNRKDLQFQILQLIEFQFISNGTAIVQIETILDELNNYIPIGQNQTLSYIAQFYILDCNINYKDVSILLFQILQKVSIISQIHINIDNYSISYKIKKIIRHGLELGLMRLQFYNKNSLILKSQTNSIYFYDLQEDLIVFDYIGRIIDQKYNYYYPLNTTHLILYQGNTSQIYIGKIGYKLDKQVEYLVNQTFTLVAENSVSQAICSIIINEINEESEDSTLLSKLLILLVLIVISYFLLRRMQLKRKQSNNEKQSKIFKDNLKVDQ